MKKTAFFAVAMLAVSCAHGGKGAASDDSKPKPEVASRLKAIKPTKQSSGVVVVWRNTRFGGLFGPMSFNGSLWIDDQAVGDVHDDSYDVLELAPGRHSFRVLGTAPGIVVPLQATTVVNVTAGEVTWMELRSIQEFNNVTLQFKPSTNAAIDAIATDCTEGFSLDLSPTTTTKL
jgi:hypothetical protein